MLDQEFLHKEDRLCNIYQYFSFYTLDGHLFSGLLKGSNAANTESCETATLYEQSALTLLH